MKVKPVCVKCGKTPKKDKNMSNHNWSVFTKCSCGGDIKLELEEK